MVNMVGLVSFAGVSMLELPGVTEFTHPPGVSIAVNTRTGVCQNSRLPVLVSMRARKSATWPKTSCLVGSPRLPAVGGRVVGPLGEVGLVRRHSHARVARGDRVHPSSRCEHSGEHPGRGVPKFRVGRFGFDAAHHEPVQGCQRVAEFGCLLQQLLLSRFHLVNQIEGLNLTLVSFFLVVVVFVISYW